MDRRKKNHKNKRGGFQSDNSPRSGGGKRKRGGGPSPRGRGHGRGHGRGRGGVFDDRQRRRHSDNNFFVGRGGKLYLAHDESDDEESPFGFSYSMLRDPKYFKENSNHDYDDYDSDASDDGEFRQTFTKLGFGTPKSPTMAKKSPFTSNPKQDKNPSPHDRKGGNSKKIPVSPVFCLSKDQPVLQTDYDVFENKITMQKEEEEEVQYVKTVTTTTKKTTVVHKVRLQVDEQQTDPCFPDLALDEEGNILDTTETSVANVTNNAEAEITDEGKDVNENTDVILEKEPEIRTPITEFKKKKKSNARYSDTFVNYHKPNIIVVDSSDEDEDEDEDEEFDSDVAEDYYQNLLESGEVGFIDVDGNFQQHYNDLLDDDAEDLEEDEDDELDNFIDLLSDSDDEEESEDDVNEIVVISSDSESDNEMFMYTTPSKAAKANFHQSVGSLRETKYSNREGNSSGLGKGNIGYDSASMYRRQKKELKKAKKLQRRVAKHQRANEKKLQIFRELNALFETFIENDDVAIMPLPPMSRFERKKVHELASLYNLKSRSFGAGKRRHPELEKIPESAIPREEEIEKWLHSCLKRNGWEDDEGDEEIPVYVKYKYNISNTTSKQKLPKSKRLKQKKLLKQSKPKYPPKSPGKSPGKSPKSHGGRLIDGQLVGDNAMPIRADNIGNKLLRSMGWEGGPLGANAQGIEDPVAAQVKLNRHGIGFSR